jgi:hypothetical protein
VATGVGPLCHLDDRRKKSLFNYYHTASQHQPSNHSNNSLSNKYQVAFFSTPLSYIVFPLFTVLHEPASFHPSLKNRRALGTVGIRFHHNLVIMKIEQLLLLSIFAVLVQAGPARSDCGVTKTFEAQNLCGVPYGGSVTTSRIQRLYTPLTVPQYLGRMC